MNCYQYCDCRCPMYHHYHSNNPCFRCVSGCSTCCCISMVKLCQFCADCGGQPIEAKQWTETVNTRTGEVVSSDKGVQEGAEGIVRILAFLCFIMYWILFGIPTLLLFLCQLCFFIPFCGGNGENIDNENYKRCYTREEVAFRSTGECKNVCLACCLPQ